MIRKYKLLVGFSLVALLLAGCASLEEDLIRAEKEKMRQERERISEQQKRAREADYDLQKSTK